MSGELHGGGRKLARGSIGGEEGRGRGLRGGLGLATGMASGERHSGTRRGEGFWEGADWRGDGRGRLLARQMGKGEARQWSAIFRLAW